MRKKLTPDVFKENGFTLVPNLIQESYQYILNDEMYEDEILLKDHITYCYKAVSAVWCNDKGQGEYYLFIREGSTAKRHEDEVITLTRNLQYEDELQDFIRLLKL